jgi:hypothetical protein
MKLALLAALRAKVIFGFGCVTQGRPLGIGQPWAMFRDIFDVVSMPRFAR